MEIDITRFFNEADPFEFSASRAERASGVSTNTSLPASRNSLHSGKCDCAGVTMTTQSTLPMKSL